MVKWIINWMTDHKYEELEKENADLKKDRDMYKKRCHDIEDKIKEDFGVTVRKEVTEIKVDFKLMELSIMYAAICKAMERPMVTEDAKYYLDLRIKIENLMQKVED